MSETKHNCKFFLLRYVPDAVKDEFINIGLVFLPPQAPLELRFTRDWSRVECLNPDADIELLKAFCDEIAKDNKEKSRELLLKKIEESFSNSLQASEYKACVTTVPAQEADQLARIYLETAQRRPASEKKAGQTIFHKMRSAFEETGAWRLMRKDIPVSDYGVAGDPLEIDCGYAVNSTIKMFHSTPLRVNVNAAKVIAFSYPRLAAGIREKEGADPRLTAIVEDSLEKNEQIGFALHTLQQHGIQVATVSQLPDLAITAARELRIG
jgi:Protein of unknown function (DUF3037)